MAIIDESWYQRPEGIPVRIAAGGIVVRALGGKILVALVKEKGFSDYILPKGKIKDGETFEQAARREILEEAGLSQLELKQYLGARERMDFRKRTWKITHYFLFWTYQRGTEPKDPQKRYSVEWFDASRLPSMLWPEQRAVLESALAAIGELLKITARGPS